MSECFQCKCSCQEHRELISIGGCRSGASECGLPLLALLRLALLRDVNKLMGVCHACVPCLSKLAKDWQLMSGILQLSSALPSCPGLGLMAVNVPFTVMAHVHIANREPHASIDASRCNLQNTDVAVHTSRSSCIPCPMHAL